LPVFWLSFRKIAVSYPVDYSQPPETHATPRKFPKIPTISSKNCGSMPIVGRCSAIDTCSFQDQPPPKKPLQWIPAYAGMTMVGERDYWWE
jgi:hypothetical protein